MRREPELYRRFGFASVPQHAFIGAAPEAVSCGRRHAPSISGARRIERVIERLLATRAPVSREIALVDAPTLVLDKLASARGRRRLDGRLYPRPRCRRRPTRSPRIRSFWPTSSPLRSRACREFSVRSSPTCLARQNPVPARSPGMAGAADRRRDRLDGARRSAFPRCAARSCCRRPPNSRSL